LTDELTVGELSRYNSNKQNFKNFKYPFSSKRNKEVRKAEIKMIIYKPPEYST